MNVRAFALPVCLALSCTFLGAGEVTIVRDGQPAALIVVSRKASAPLQAAAGTLADFLREASGAQLKVVREDALPKDWSGTRIHVGPNAMPATRGLVPAGLDGDGFVIQTAGRDVAIAGPSDDGTEFGVYEFLERFAGVRWLLPGEDGTDVPRRSTLVIPEGRVQDQPVFFSRLFSGLQGPAQTRWARCNRMHGRVSFHHNLLHLFPPSRYAQTRPEFFPVLQGDTRYRPTGDDDHGWQPCFTAPGIVDEAVKNIIQFFHDHPGEPSYSLGMNDSMSFCRCASCLAKIPGEKNYVGSVNYSELYYDWCNRVIAGVLKQYPDKWFGCLAYFNVATPPAKGTVHPRLVPYITYDRLK